MKRLGTILLGSTLLLSSVAYGLRARPQLEVHYNIFENKVLVINGQEKIWNELRQVAVLSLSQYFKLRFFNYKPKNFFSYSTEGEVIFDVHFNDQFQEFVLVRRLEEGIVIIEYLENLDLRFSFNLNAELYSSCHLTEVILREFYKPSHNYPDKFIQVDWLKRVVIIKTFEGHEIILSLDEKRLISDTYKPELRSESCKKHYHGPNEDYVFPDFIHRIYLLDQNNEDRGIWVEDIFPERVKKAGVKMPTRCHYNSFKGGGGRCEPIWGEAFE